ncbi:putative Serine/threonine-protein phosphatase 6 catalytic subunit [Paratrimastix pyriformis]|uniref:Serine/threonine-protein phosphatase n=1 Tax=Paratrimastix pyriformis TaxID=342808 RepID=A0ABQ8UMD8_9EUKA|nr:putative Serine/threonine-protein phosphatase 6 catalytic subunit [Paratrimastix pyriformis]
MKFGQTGRVETTLFTSHKMEPEPLGLDLDLLLEKLRKKQPLSQEDFIALSDYVVEILLEEGTVQPVSAPVTVCGDIHGQFYDMLQLFKIGGEVPNTKYVFMGDYVDRGYHSLETFSLLMCLKARYPSRITLLRGNHETRQITQAYGFYDDCMKRYGNALPWRKCMEVFDYLPIAALIDNKVLCVHGGLSPELKTLDQICTIQRRQEVPHEGAFCDLMWSDPEALDGWAISPRGAGYLFGHKVAKQFNQINGLDLICRAHQLVNEGYKHSFPDQCVVTVWSAPNYCYRCGNIAAIMQLDDVAKAPKFITFCEVPESQRDAPPRQVVPYFL